MIVLDTNVVSEAMKPTTAPAVLAWLSDQAAETLYLSSVTLAELMFGAGALPAGKGSTAGVRSGDPTFLNFFKHCLSSIDADGTRLHRSAPPAPSGVTV